MTRDDIAAFFADALPARRTSSWPPPGDLDHDDGRRPASTAASPAPSGGAPDRAPRRRRPRRRRSSMRPADRAGPPRPRRGAAFAAHDPDRYALAVVNQVLGGGMSSRLFQEIREQRGLAYSVYSYAVALRRRRLARGLRRHRARARSPRCSTLHRRRARRAAGRRHHRATSSTVAKGYLEGSMLLGLEDSGSRMARLGSDLVGRGEHHRSRRAPGPHPRGDPRRCGEGDRPGARRARSVASSARSTSPGHGDGRPGGHRYARRRGHGPPAVGARRASPVTATSAFPHDEAPPVDGGPKQRRFTRWFRAAYSPRQRRWLLAILVLAAVLRIGWVAYAARPTVQGDSLAYTGIGTEIAHGHGYANFAVGLGDPQGRLRPYPPTAFYPVGYPATLGGLFWVVFHTPIPDNLAKAVGYFQAVLGVATVAMGAELGRRLFNGRVAVGAAAILAVFPSLIFYTAQAQLETVFNFVVLAALLVVVARPWGDRWQIGRGRLIAFGAVLGLSALLRPNTLLFVPLAVVVWLVVGAGWRRSLMQALWVTLAAVVVVSPWIIRNAVRLDAPVFSTGSGDAFCVGHHPGTSGRYELAIADCLKPYDHYPFPEREVKRNSGNTREAVDFVLHHPSEEASLWLLARLLRLSRRPRGDQRPFPAQQLPRAGWRRVLTTVADGFYFGVLALGLIGLPAFASRRRPRALFVLLCMASLAALPFLLFGDPRYKVPVLPFLAVSAAVSLSMLVDRVTPVAHRRGRTGGERRERRLTLSPSCRLPRPPARARRAPR